MFFGLVKLQASLDQARAMLRRERQALEFAIRNPSQADPRLVELMATLINGEFHLEDANSDPDE